MLNFSSAVRVFVALAPVDLRGSFNRLSALTPREREVLAAMAEGRTNAGIAEALTITEGAAEKHITSIIGKLDLPDTRNDHRRVLAVLAYLDSDG